MPSQIVQDAVSEYNNAYGAWSLNYNWARDDLRFLSHTEGAQWYGDTYQERVRNGRIAVTLDKIDQFCNQVHNAIRSNTPKIEVIPHSGGADVETAAIIAGIIKDIEYQSSADTAYDIAIGSAIRCGLGWLRVDHEYEDENSFNQVCRILAVNDPLSIVIDGNSKETDGSDAMFAFALQDLNVDAFKKQYKGAEIKSFNGNNSTWTNDIVTIAEYFKIIEKPIELLLLSNGEVIEASQLNDMMLLAMGVQVINSRKSTRKSVKRYKLSGDEVLEEGVFPGQMIPIVPVYGQQQWIDGRREISSLIRRSKDAQALYNYFKSVEMEMLRKINTAQFMAPAEAIANFEDVWADPEKAVVLYYNSLGIDGNPLNPPASVPPPVLPNSAYASAATLVNDIQASMGLYDAFLGQRSNETSGVAIKQRKEEGNMAVFHYPDNLYKSVERAGKIIVNMFSEVYDTPRIVAAVLDDESRNVGINGARVEGQTRDFQINSNDKYNVRVLAAPSNTTVRQDAAEFYGLLLKEAPEIRGQVLPLMLKNSDMPGAQEIAKKLQEGGDPALQQMQQELQALQAENQELKQKYDLEVAKLQLEEQKATAELKIKQQELAIKQRETANVGLQY